MPENQTRLLEECRGKEFHAYGTGKIFERRARTYRHALNLLTFLGIVVPASVGALVLAFGVQWKYMHYVFVGSGTLAGVQLVVSLWSAVSGWSNKLEVASNSVQGNLRLYNEWKSLADRPDDDLEVRVRELQRLNEEQEVYDLRQDVTEREQRYAMRASLFYYQRECRACGQVPTSLRGSKCDMCGK